MVDLTNRAAEFSAQYKDLMEMAKNKNIRYRKLFFEKGSIAKGPSLRKYWAVLRFFMLCLTYPVIATSS